MTTIIVTDIDYDASDYDKAYNLPTTIRLEVDLSDFEGTDQLEAYLSDEISNITGYCHKGFTYQSIN